MKYPLKQTVFTTTGGRWVEDDLGNDYWAAGERTPVKVFAFEVVRSEETTLAGHERLVEVLKIYAPPGSFEPQKRVELPDGTFWEVDGNAEDYNNNSWWSPGLVTFQARKVD